jgi:hypothetical protein
VYAEGAEQVLFHPNQVTAITGYGSTHNTNVLFSKPSPWRILGKCPKDKIMNEPTANQIKQLERTINDAAADLEYVTEFLVAELKGAEGVEESVILKAVQTAAQRCLWLAVWDKAFSFGLDLPEYSKAGGTTARLLVDREASRLTLRLAA